jgi:hypothetical protein
MRRAAGVVCVLAVALAAAASAVASSKGSEPPPTPSSLALTTTDFAPGAQVSKQKTQQQSGGVVLFERAFGPGARIGSRFLAGVLDEVLLYPTASAASGDFTLLKALLRTKAGRAQLAKEFLSGLGSKKNRRKPIVSRLVPMGPQAARLSITAKTSLGRLTLAFDMLQLDRVVELVALVGLPGQRVAISDAVLAVTKARAHLVAGFTVVSTAPPTVVGTPAQGQTLSVDEGTWTGGPSTFTYAWQRCDATGANCAPIAGATVSTYVPTSADSGSTLNVVVTGQNTVSSAAGTSAATAVVP